MRKIFAAIVLLMSLCVPSWADYDVNEPHVIINQIFGGGGGYVSHSFIELYNPTDSDVNLEGWAVHYRSAPEDTASSDKWYMTELTGTIPSHHSYLILGGEDSSFASSEYNSSERTLSEYDKILTGGGGVKRNLHERCISNSHIKS